MDLPLNLLFTAFLILAAAIDGAHADAMVTGTVFCDQCKDGQRSLFDYPLYGMILDQLHFLFSKFCSLDVVSHNVDSTFTVITPTSSLYTVVHVYLSYAKIH